MARTLYQTLIRLPSPPTLPKTTSSARFLTHRAQSSQSGKAVQLIEVDLDPETEESAVMGMRRLEDAIHGIMVRRSAPDWLPFIPGSSYWVPPRKRPYGIMELVGKLASPLSDEESMSVSSARGWPSASYFVEGGTPSYPVEVMVNSKTTSQSSEAEDEEG